MYLSIKKMLGSSVEDVEEIRRLKWNTLLIYWKDGHISLRLYYTDVIKYYPNKKKIIIDTDGYIWSRLTREKINHYIRWKPFYTLYLNIDTYYNKDKQKCFYLRTDEDCSIFRDGIELRLKENRSLPKFRYARIINPVTDIEYYIYHRIYSKYGMYKDYNEYEKNWSSEYKKKIDRFFCFDINNSCKECKKRGGISRNHLFLHLGNNEIPMRIFKKAIGKNWKAELICTNLFRAHRRFMRISILRLKKYLRENYG